MAGSTGLGPLGSTPKDIDAGTLCLDASPLPGPLGCDADVIPAAARIIAQVTKDWDPPNPKKTPEIVVRGRTLAEVADELNRLPEWGQAGGSIRSEPIARGTSSNLNIKLFANLVYRIPRWTNYERASPAAKREWDNMIGKLRAHEDRHLAIAIEEADKLAGDLIGHDIADIADMVTAANRRMHDRQEEMDHDTDHGAKAGVPYGDVILDPTVT